VALLGPGAASAGSYSPDPPSSTGAPAPDPVPVPAMTTPPPSRAPVVRSAPAEPVSARRVVAPTTAAHARPAAHRPRKRAVYRAVQIVDVPPLQVDLHRELGAVAAPLRDDSTALLAGIALLVAAAVGASALALTLVATRAPRSAT